eukprot:gene13997-29796_t
MSRSSSTSTIVGEDDYINGIKNGFIERNGEFAELKTVKELVLTSTGQHLGDIDLKFTIQKEIRLKDLFPYSSIVQHDMTVYANTNLLLEVTASKGQSILFKKSPQDMNKLEKKVQFFDYLFNNNFIDANDICVIVYNGTDPVNVKTSFDALNPRFRGGVIHFQRRFISAWELEEKLQKSELKQAQAQEALEQARKVAQALAIANERIRELEANLVRQAALAKEGSTTGANFDNTTFSM